MKDDHVKPSFPTETVQEGRVKVFVPKLKEFVKSPSDYAPSKAPVFYNPIMELNRDISVLALQAYQKLIGHEVSVCDPLTGSGVRGIRYAAEIKGIKRVVINDISEQAFRLAGYNVQITGLSEHVVVENQDANCLLSDFSAPHKRFDVVDIDPFGSPVPYLDSAIRALRSNGLLALTATDMAPLCGIHPKACTRKYGGKPLRTEYCHELAVRLLAGCVATTAAKYDIGAHVVFSLYTNHYVRLFVVIKYGAKEGDKSLRNIGHVLHCFKCFHRETIRDPLIGHSDGCIECGSKLSAGGPMWIGKLFDRQFCELMLEEANQRTSRLGKRIGNILALARDEVDAPFSYYVVDALCDALSLPMPSAKTVASALQKRGFQALFTHLNPNGIRSDVSAMEIQEILREIAGSA